MIRLPTSIDWPLHVRAFAASFACAAILTSVQVMAEPTAAERSLAAALFDQGRTLMTEGKLDEACSKLAESQRLDPGGGTLLNLALCHEKQGKIATAWTEFREARAIAKRDNRPDRESAADGEISKLEPQLFKVSVVVAADIKVPGMTIEIDGLPLPEAAWGTPFPVDPGSRAIIVRAPGYREWRGMVEAGKTAGTANVNVPNLQREGIGDGDVIPAPTGTSTGTPPPPGSSAPGPDAPSSGMRTGGFVVGGIGVLLIGVGSVTGAMAIAKGSKATELGCKGAFCPNAEALEQSDQGLTLAHVSTATFAIGLASVAAGTIMILAAPKKAPVQASISVGPQFISVTGKF